MMRPPFLAGLLEAVAKEQDPAVRARVAHQLLVDLGAAAESMRMARRDALERLRDGGQSWEQLGQLLGVSSERARWMAGD